jgi:uncharacterized protein (DUF1330 family)
MAGDAMEVRTPTPAELAALREKVGDGPVVIVNLQKFREPGGSEAFGEYGRSIGPLMEQVGAEPIFAASAGPSLAGPEWDLVVLVRFPDIDAFTTLIGSDTYQQVAGPIRESALERTVWLVSHPLGG